MAEEKKPLTREMKALGLTIEQATRQKSIFNVEQINKLWNSTRAKYTYERPGKGGGNWKYVKASYVRKVLDSVFGFNWDFNIDTSVAEAFEVAKVTGVCVVKGTISGRAYVDGKWVEIKKTQFGRQEVKFKKELVNGLKMPLDFGNDMKGATSDCLKKCASLLGIAADIYEPDEFMVMEVLHDEDYEDKKKATKSKLETARKILKDESTKVEEKDKK